MGIILKVDSWNANTMYLYSCRSPGVSPVLISSLFVLPLLKSTTSTIDTFHDVLSMQEFEAQTRILEQCKITAKLTVRAQNKLYWVSGSFLNFCPQASTLLYLDWSQNTYRYHTDVLWTKHVLCFRGIFCFYFFPLSLWSSSCPVPFFPPPSSWSQGPD